MFNKKRPENVPLEAVWIPEDYEWGLGEKKDDKCIGEWKWWRPDGSLACHSFFNEEGQLEGIARRYHPNGEISLYVRYHKGKIFGKAIYTKVTSGESPENLNFPEEPKSLYRMEYIQQGNSVNDDCLTFYNLEGVKEPIESDVKGYSIDLGNQLHKLLTTTKMIMLSDELKPIEGRNIKLGKGTIVIYWGLALVNGTIHRIKLPDKTITVVEAEEINKKLSLTIDKADLDIAQKIRKGEL
jgi:hypothetical protein